MDIPSSALQLLVALLFVVPGTTYQAVRSRLRGPTPADASAALRILTALAASAALDAIYAFAAGPTIVRLVRPAGSHGYGSGFLAHPRETGLLALLLLFAIPAGVAMLDYVRLHRRVLRPKRRWLVSYDPTPRAWDFAFRDIRPSFVRVLTVDGRWLGGWYGSTSFASGYPEPREIFIQSAYQMGQDGSFGALQPHTNGLYVRCDDVRSIEFVDQMRPEAHNRNDEQEEATSGDGTKHRAVDRPAQRRLQRNRRANGRRAPGSDQP